MIDLHTHSTKSDGTCSPAELVQLAAAEGIHLLALTDHDTINGIKVAQETARELGIRFIPGIEIEVSHPSNEFHVLGLGISAENESFIRGLEQLKQNRTKRNRKILEKINKAGIALSLTEMETAAGGDTIGRPHFARSLVNKGVVNSINEAFRQYLGAGKPFYVHLDTPTLEEGIALIKDGGGIAVAAHPVTLRLPVRKLKEFLLECRDKGLDGIEVYHPYHNIQLSRQLEKFALYNNLLITGGSDFHGKRREERKLGYISEDTPVPPICGSCFPDKLEFSSDYLKI